MTHGVTCLCCGRSHVWRPHYGKLQTLVLSTHVPPPRCLGRFNVCLTVTVSMACFYVSGLLHTCRWLGDLCAYCDVVRLCPPSACADTNVRASVHMWPSTDARCWVTMIECTIQSRFVPCDMCRRIRSMCAYDPFPRYTRGNLFIAAFNIKPINPRYWWWCIVPRNHGNTSCNTLFI